MKKSTETVIQPFEQANKGVKTGSLSPEDKPLTISPEGSTEKFISPALKGVEHI